MPLSDISALDPLAPWKSWEATRQGNAAIDTQRLQNTATTMGILANMQKMQQAAKYRDLMAQAGNDPEAAMMLGIRAGMSPEDLAHFAPIIKVMNEAKQTKALAGLDMSNPDAVAHAGLLTGHAPLIAEAERIRKNQAAVATQNSLSSADIPITDVPTMGNDAVSRANIPTDAQPGTPEYAAADEQAKQMALAAADRGEKVAISAGGDPATQKAGGLFSSLIASPVPQISQQAKMLQAAMERSDPRLIPPQHWQDYQTRLSDQESKITQAQTAREQSLAGRKDLMQLGATLRPEPAPSAHVVPDASSSTGFSYKDLRDGRTLSEAPTPSGASNVVFGSREASQINRVIMSANQASHDLANVTKLPLSNASSGFLGGRGQEVGILHAGAETLANKMTTQDVQTYNVFATGFQRALSAIEAAGMMPNGALMRQMESVIFREGDTNLTKLQKLAQTRQILDTGLETISANPRVPPELKAHIEDVRKSAEKAVPFTQQDILALQQGQRTNPKLTLADVIKSTGAAKSGATDTPLVNAKGWALHVDKNSNKAYVSPDGKQVEEVR